MIISRPSESQCYSVVIHDKEKNKTSLAIVSPGSSGETILRYHCSSPLRRLFGSSAGVSVWRVCDTCFRRNGRFELFGQPRTSCAKQRTLRCTRGTTVGFTKPPRSLSGVNGASNELSNRSQTAAKH